MPRRRKRRQSDISSADVEENSERNLLLEDDRPKKPRKRVIAETSGQSGSPLENEASPSTSARDSRRSSRLKCKRSDMEKNTCSRSSTANDAAASIDNCSNRESPELGCSICLGAVENRAFTDACYHTFCFECLVEWSRVRAVCPLCKKSFHSIIHSFRSYDDYKLYQVPTSYFSNFVNISSHSTSESSNFFRIGRYRSVASPTLPPFSDGDHMLALRRRVYTHSEEMQLRGLWSSDGVVVSPPHQVSPAMFDCYPVMLERVRPWVLRDLAVIIGNGDFQHVANIVLDLLRHLPIMSEDFYERLFPYLGLHTRRFLLELDAFARSPFDMTTYDARVVYSTGANVETSHRLLTEPVEDISSSDDSDIEIVSPAVIASSESMMNSHINRMSDHVVPDLLRCLRTFQHKLLMSFSFMNRQSHDSRLDSPVPGPSGLGQAVVTEESDSVGGRASRLVHDAEEQSNSPMVLSDADSDVMVVDVDSPVHSPIHISSGEDDDVSQQIRTHQRVKRRRHRRRSRRARKERGSEREQCDNLAYTSECAEKTEDSEELPRDELHSTDLKSADRCVESDFGEPMHAVEHTDHMQNQSSSHSSSMKLNDDSSAGVKFSPSEHYLPTSDGKTANEAKHTLHHTHSKRSRNANSVTNLPVMSVSSGDDVKPLTCKKHVSGHKSSKQKARELVAENRSAETVSDDMEKLASVDTVQAMTESHILPGTAPNEESSADLPNEVTVPSVGTSSIASADLSINPLPSEVPDEQKLATGSCLDDETPVPCTSETNSLSDISFTGPDLEDIKCSLSSRVKVAGDIARDCLTTENGSLYPDDDSACYSSCDVVQVHSLKNSAGIAHGSSNVDDWAALDLSSYSAQPSNDDVACSVTDLVHCGDVSSPCVNVAVTSSQQPSPVQPSPDPHGTHERSQCSFETSCNVSISAASSASSNSQIHIHPVTSCKLENKAIDIPDDQPLQIDSDSLPVVPQGNNSVVFASSSSHQALEFNHNASCLHTDAAEDKSLLQSCDIHITVSGTSPSDWQPINGSLAEQLQSPSSLPSADLVVDENQNSPASPSPIINDSIFIGSPVGIDSSDSDSEVEWLETGMSGRQRCISISSGGSSIVFSPSDVDGVESVLSDTDSLEIFDDEPLSSVIPPGQSAESSRSSQGDADHSPTLNSALVLSSSDVASAVDVCETETVVNSEQVKMEQNTELFSNDTIAVADPTNESSGEIALQSDPTADGHKQDSDTSVPHVEVLGSQQ